MGPQPPKQELLLTYFFKCNIELSDDHITQLTTTLKVSDPHTTSKKSSRIGGLYWHVFVFRQGANKAEHHGKEHILEDGTKVKISVSELVSDALRVITQTKNAVDFLESLKILPVEEVEKLHATISYFLIEGHFAITERASQIEYIKEELLKYGVSEFLMKQIIPRFGTEVIEALGQLSDAEQKKKIESLLITVISVGISIHNIINSIVAIVNTRDQFQRQVKHFLKPVLVTLRQLLQYTNSIVSLLERFMETKEMEILQAVPYTLDLTAAVMEDLLKKIPTIEKHITQFLEAKIKTQEEKRKQAIAAALLSLPSLYQAGTGLYKVAKEGTQALNALQKVELTADITRFVAYAAEGAAATVAYYDIKTHVEYATQHLKFYSSIRNSFNMETNKVRDDMLRSFIASGASSMYLFQGPLGDFKLQSEKLSELIKMGDALQ